MIRLLDARVFHARMRPRRNQFRYGALYLVANVDALSLPRREGLFSVDRTNLFSIRPSDYGDGVTPPARWIRNVLDSWNVTEADGEAWLMTMPRILGYAFNPVSFWFCFDRDGALRAVLAEVNNTFGERHSYLCFRDDHGPIGPQDTVLARKVFHVSPFIEVEGEYSFKFSATAERVAVSIDLSDGDGVLLRTSVGGLAAPLTSMRLLGALVRNPLFPLKVIALIHYQAAKLFLKGVRHFGKPVPPALPISR
jgi:uncharacterized protein